MHSRKCDYGSIRQPIGFLEKDPSFWKCFLNARFELIAQSCCLCAHVIKIPHRFRYCYAERCEIARMHRERRVFQCRSFSAKKSSYTLRRMKTGGVKCKIVDARAFKMEKEFSDRSTDVDMEADAFCLADARKIGDRLDHAGKRIGPRDRKHSSSRLNFCFEGFRPKAPTRINGKK